MGKDKRTGHREQRLECILWEPREGDITRGLVRHARWPGPHREPRVGEGTEGTEIIGSVFGGNQSNCYKM